MMHVLGIFIVGFCSGGLTILAIGIFGTAKLPGETEADFVKAEVDFAFYADTLCEFGTGNEGCGKYPDAICFGCRARKHTWRHKV